MVDRHYPLRIAARDKQWAATVKRIDAENAELNARWKRQSALERGSAGTATEPDKE